MLDCRAMVTGHRPVVASRHQPQVVGALSEVRDEAREAEEARKAAEASQKMSES